MDCNDVKEGLRVKIGSLGDTLGMFINPRHLASRASGKTGEVLTYVPGHGGDVWYVRHDDETKTVGVYVYHELEKE